MVCTLVRIVIPVDELAAHPGQQRWQPWPSRHPARIKVLEWELDNAWLDRDCRQESTRLECNQRLRIRRRPFREDERLCKRCCLPRRLLRRSLFHHLNHVPPGVCISFVNSDHWSILGLGLAAGN